ncbi:pantothenate synthetase, partial [Aureobasidium melanogenum]
MAQRMRAVQYTSVQGGLEKNLRYTEEAQQPQHDEQMQRGDHIMVEVISASINQLDWKMPETPVIGKALTYSLTSSAKIPGMDYCGRIKSTGSTIDSFSIGELVYGRLTRPTSSGTLAQYVNIDPGTCIPLPEGVNPDHAATIGVAGETAYRSIVPNVQTGDRVFINGGSSGTGTYGIQIAKLLGCHVTVSCSTSTIELCKELGADEVFDYSKTDIIAELIESGKTEPFDLVVDDVGQPEDLYKESHLYLKPEGKFISIGSRNDIASLAARTLPTFLGGGRRKSEQVHVLLGTHRDDLVQLGRWMAEGKIKAVIDSTYPLADAAEAVNNIAVELRRDRMAFPRFRSFQAVSQCPTYTPSAIRRAIHTFREVQPLRTFRKELQASKRTVGFVPTMGALHEGHISLMRQAAAENTDVFVSIYVNPTQFGVNEDLDSYPKTWQEDMDKLQALNKELQTKEGSGKITAIFAPITKTMYPTLPPTSEINGSGSFVTITPLGSLLEGASRPVFFRGVATVCMKLFNIVMPERVYFGQKDVQQTVVIKRMVKDFHLDTEVKIGPTEREADGLAMSSRNVYLGARRREVGVVLSRALKAAEKKYLQGKRLRADILWPANEVSTSKMMEQDDLPPSKRARVEVDYISLADPDTMEEIEVVDASKGAILSGAIKMLPLEEPQEGEVCGLGGGAVPVRLIDNIILQPIN